MKIDYLIHEKFKEPEIRICNHELNDEMRQLHDILDQTVNFTILGYDQGEVRVLRCNEIYRIYSENQRTLVESQHHTYQLHATLSEMEQRVPENEFIRISRSEIVNLKKIRKIDTSISRTIQMYLKNGTQTFVSRRNVGQIKIKLGL